jgi:hypothetical protein
MFILNGRLNGDKDGNFTCKGTSVVADFFWRGRLFVEQKVPKVILALSTNILPIFSAIELTLPEVMSTNFTV